jgi:hypothetical protein
MYMYVYIPKFSCCKLFLGILKACYSVFIIFLATIDFLIITLHLSIFWMCLFFMYLFNTSKHIQQFQNCQTILSRNNFIDLNTVFMFNSLHLLSYSFQLKHHFEKVLRAASFLPHLFVKLCHTFVTPSFECAY